MSCHLLHLMQTSNKPDKSDRNWTELIFVKSGKQILNQPLTRSGHYFLTFWYTTGELTGLSNFYSQPSLAASSGWTPPLPLWNVPAVVTMIKFWWGGPSLFRDLAKFSPNTFLLHNQTHHRRCFSWKEEYHWWNPNVFKSIFTLFPNINLSSVLDRSTATQCDEEEEKAEVGNCSNCKVARHRLHTTTVTFTK